MGQGSTRILIGVNQGSFFFYRSIRGQLAFLKWSIRGHLGFLQGSSDVLIGVNQGYCKQPIEQCRWKRKKKPMLKQERTEEKIYPPK